MNDVPPKPYAEQPGDEDLRRFCPFAHQIIPGPLGSVTIARPECDLEHCKLADQERGRCRMADLADVLVRLSVALEAHVSLVEKLIP